MTAGNDREQIDLTIYELLCSFVDSEFPKTCNCCGKVYPDLDSFLVQTDPGIDDQGMIFDQPEDTDKRIVALMRNCRCKTTLMVVFNERRNVTDYGTRVRSLFDRLKGVVDDYLNSRDKSDIRKLTDDRLRDVFTGLLGCHEEWVIEHSERAAETLMIMADKAGIRSEEILAVMHSAAVLHDVGILSIPYGIVNKPGTLSTREMAIMRTHPETGRKLVLSFPPFDPRMAEIISAHHERFDGKGYPRGLKGDQIPSAARLFAVVDAYDSLRFDRPYRQGIPREKALAEINSGSGTQFDPEAVQIFNQAIDEIEEFYRPDSS